MVAHPHNLIRLHTVVVQLHTSHAPSFVPVVVIRSVEIHMSTLTSVTVDGYDEVEDDNSGVAVESTLQ